jgi:hypothetical protein
MFACTSSLDSIYISASCISPRYDSISLSYLKMTDLDDPATRLSSYKSAKPSHVSTAVRVEDTTESA